MAKAKPKTTIPEPLVQAVAKYCAGDTDSAFFVISAVLKANAHPKADPLDIADKAIKAAQARALCFTAIALGKGFKAVTPIAGVTPPTKSVSPHAPVAKGKKDYWVKVVTSVYRSEPNAWGIKGRFINPEATATFPEDTPVMGVTNKWKNKSAYLMRSKHGKPTNIPFPPTSPHAPLCVSGSVIVKVTSPSTGWWLSIMDTLVRKAGVKDL